MFNESLAVMDTYLNQANGCPNASISSILKINGLPTILFINDMSVIARAEGMLMADELQSLAEHHFFGGEKPVIEGLTV